MDQWNSSSCELHVVRASSGPNRNDLLSSPFFSGTQFVQTWHAPLAIRVSIGYFSLTELTEFLNTSSIGVRRPLGPLLLGRSAIYLILCYSITILGGSLKVNVDELTAWLMINLLWRSRHLILLTSLVPHYWTEKNGFLRNACRLCRAGILDLIANLVLLRSSHLNVSREIECRFLSWYSLNHACRMHMQVRMTPNRICIGGFKYSEY